MATPTLGLLNYTLINDADANTGWTLTTTVDTDIKKQGTGSVSGILRTDNSVAYYTNGVAISAVEKTIRMWVMTNNLAYMDTEANGGYEMSIYDGSVTGYKTMFGSDTYKGGWYNAVINTALFTTITLANAIRWGLRVQHIVSAANKINTWIDRICYLDGYYVTGGTSGDEITLAGIAIIDEGTTTLNGYGVIILLDGVYFCTGKLIIGNGATTTWFEMDGDVLVFTDQDVGAGLYQLTGEGSGCRISINNSVIKSSGTTDNTRFLIDMDEANLVSLIFTNNVISRAAAINFKSGQTVTGNTFNNCGQITPAGANMSSSKVFGYEGTADTAALDWDVVTDPDGYLDDMTFTKGTASTHAIEFGITSPTSVTLNGIVFSGYNASNSQTDSTFLVSRTTGTVIINLSGCSGNVTYKSAGATVVLVVNPVTIGVTVKDLETGSVITSQDVRVFVAVASDANYPYNDSVTITNSSTTATATHTAHGLVSNDKVWIKGASHYQNNGVFSITYIDGDSYSYTMSSAPGSNPTGTITSTFVPLEGLTNTSGYISASKSYSSDQPVTGWGRKSSDTPLYKTGSISGDIDNVAGVQFTVLLAKDE